MTKDEFDKLFHNLVEDVDNYVTEQAHQHYDELVSAGDKLAFITALMTESRTYTNNLVYQLFLKLVVEPSQSQP